MLSRRGSFPFGGFRLRHRLFSDRGVRFRAWDPEGLGGVSVSGVATRPLHSPLVCLERGCGTREVRGPFREYFS